MTDKVREQILKVRETGKTNMFDIYTVQRIGLKMGFYDMVIFIEENKSEYVNFILHGDEKGRVEQNKTRFAKDYATVLEWDPEAEEIIKRRKEEITRLKQEGRSCSDHAEPLLETEPRPHGHPVELLQGRGHHDQKSTAEDGEVPDETEHHHGQINDSGQRPDPEITHSQLLLVQLRQVSPPCGGGPRRACRPSGRRSSRYRRP